MYQKDISKPGQEFYIYLYRNETSFMPLHHISLEKLCASVHLAEIVWLRATAGEKTSLNEPGFVMGDVKNIY